jgi:hypothetical protein
MKKAFLTAIIALVIGTMATVAVAAQSGETGGLYRIPDDRFYTNYDTINLPEAAKYGAGTLDDDIEYSSEGFTLRLTNASLNDFNSLVNHYKGNGGKVSYSTDREYDFNFNWGTIVISYFGLDKEIGVVVSLK